MKNDNNYSITTTECMPLESVPCSLYTRPAEETSQTHEICKYTCDYYTKEMRFHA